MAENVSVAVIVIAGVILACQVWYWKGRRDGLRAAKRILEKHSNRREENDT